MLQEIFKFSTEILRSLKDKAGKKKQSLFRTPFIFEILILYPLIFSHPYFIPPFISRFLFQTPGQILQAGPGINKVQPLIVYLNVNLSQISRLYH